MPRKHRHHVITRAHCKRYGIETNHPSNLHDLNPLVHFAHHRCLPKLSVRDLRPDTLAWIENDLNMGWYLARYYADYEEKTANERDA